MMRQVKPWASTARATRSTKLRIGWARAEMKPKTVGSDPVELRSRARVSMT
ncbi:hypothetical protein D3C72_2450050 [compost metagenome]